MEHPTRTKIVCILLLVTATAGDDTSKSPTFIDQEEKLTNLSEPQWYLENIPFIDIPNKMLEQVYYYRWSSHKRHLRYTTPGAGYIVTEFIHKIAHSQKFDTINAAAGHHIYESRWLRDPRYVEDYINFWAREGAANQQYSEWIADAAYATYRVLGNRDFIVSQLPGLVENFRGWEDRFERTLNLYFLSPHDDAMEHSASSEQTDDPYHGGVGYRPSFNSEMYGNAKAIAEIALLAEEPELVAQFQQRASDLRQGILHSLWDPQRTFFYHVFREDNPGLDKLDTREEIGFFPFKFGVPDVDNYYDSAWEHLLDPEGFNSTYGPTTCEQRSPWFDGNQTAQCCWWNGNSWPYSTGFVISALATQIKVYGSTQWANVETFEEVINKYAETQFKEGQAYVAECHSPYRKIWVGDTFNNSEHYAHSTFVDNVLADLLGIEAQADNTVVINPLVPADWSYFAVENVLYHGQNMTVLYDETGTKYNSTGGRGLHIFVNGQLVQSTPTLERVVVEIPPGGDYIRQRETDRRENYAANVNGFGYPLADASYTSEFASVWQAVDGRRFYDFVPSNRWTNFGSPNERDWFSVDFGPGRKKWVSEVKIYVYSDVVTGEGGVDCPTNVTVEVYDSPREAWVPVTNQLPSPIICVPNDVLTITFDPIQAQQLRLVFSRDREFNWFVGMTEMELWSPWPQVASGEEGMYEAEDGYLSTTKISILASASASGGSYLGHMEISPESSLEFNGIWVDDSKQYDLRVYYSNGAVDAATMDVTVNNLHTQTVTFPQTANSWGEFDENTFVDFQIPFLWGNNVLIFKQKTGAVDLDKIKVNSPSGFTVVTHGVQ